LSAIDATKKIAIIKEVRELTKLGLKEVKIFLGNRKSNKMCE